MLPSSLTISVVTFRPDRELLRRCLSNLETAVRVAREKGVVRSVAVALIDNSEDRDVAEEVIALGRGHFVDADVQVTCLHGHANIGYRTAHNLMLHGTGADYQLVLNPDVELAPDALANAIRWLDTHPEVGVAAPAVTRQDGEPDYLCKRYPAVFDLFLRGFAPGFVRRMFRQRLEHYEIRDWINPASEAPVLGIPVMSGCCLLARRRAIDATGGFDPSRSDCRSRCPFPRGGAVLRQVRERTARHPLAGSHHLGRHSRQALVCLRKRPAAARSSCRTGGGIGPGSTSPV